MFKKCRTTAILLFLAAASLQGQITDKVGTNGFQFLKIGVGTRETALAGAGTAVPSGAAAIHWNVAGITTDDRTSFIFFHNRWIADINHNYFAFKTPLSDQHFLGLAVDLFDMGDMEETTIDEPQGTGRTFSAGDMAITGSYAVRVSDRFSAGVSAKYVREHIWDLAMDGWAFDVGLLYVLDRVHLGMAFKDFGTEKSISGSELESDLEIFNDWDTSPVPMALVTKGIRLPMSFHVGAGYDVMTNSDHRLVAMGNLCYYNDIGQVLNCAAEYTLLDALSLRGGYQFGRDAYSFTGGIGVRANLGGMDLSFGYAVIAMEDFGPRSQFDISLSLQGLE